MKLFNSFIEKRVVFMGLLLLFILISVTLVSGDIVFKKVHPGRANTSPYITGYKIDNTLLKRIEITSGRVEWPREREVKVSIMGRAYGVGVGEGTLRNINILGKDPVPMHQDGSDSVWEKKEPNGAWKKGYGLVTTTFTDVVPKDTEATSYSWDAEGDVALTAWLWQETVTHGGTIRYPFAVQGTFSTSGTWIKDPGDPTTQSARKTDETHAIYHKYYCSICKAEGDTQESIGGKEAHALVTCPNCGEQYHKCDKKAAKLHSKPAGSDWYNCDPMSVSFNKTSFTSDETLVVTIEKKGLTSAYIMLNGQYKEARSLDAKPYTGAPDKITISYDFSNFNFSGLHEWYGKVTVFVNYRSNGTLAPQYWTEQYISVEKVGLFEDNRYLTSYRTYNAKVVENNPIKSVKWSLKKPGGEWEEVTHDKVKGGKSSSWSYTASSGSTTGKYEVKAVVHLEIPTTNNYTGSFYVY